MVKTTSLPSVHKINRRVDFVSEPRIIHDVRFVFETVINKIQDDFVFKKYVSSQFSNVTNTQAFHISRLFMIQPNLHEGSFECALNTKTLLSYDMQPTVLLSPTVFLNTRGDFRLFRKNVCHSHSGGKK